MELEVSPKGSMSSAGVGAGELDPTTRIVGASDVDSCMGPDTGNLERELVVKAGGGDGRGGGGVPFLDWASWKTVLPDPPLAPLYPEIGLTSRCPRSLELGPASTSGPR